MSNEEEKNMFETLFLLHTVTATVEATVLNLFEDKYIISNSSSSKKKLNSLLIRNIASKPVYFETQF